MPQKLLADEEECPNVHGQVYYVKTCAKKWKIFVNINSGNHDMIDTVGFLPDVDVEAEWNSNGSLSEEVPVRKSMRDSFKVKLTSKGGTSIIVDCPLLYSDGGSKKFDTYFIPHANSKNVLPIPKSAKFGVELELSDENGSDNYEIAEAIEEDSGFEVTVVDEYCHAHDLISEWKLVYDSSIACRSDAPDCSKFELVSPILEGEQGIESCYQVLEALKSQEWTSINVNRTMGFHVHIDVKDLSLAELKKVCQNFIKFEESIDSFMPPSRRTGSQESNTYCKSCKKGITDEEVSARCGYSTNSNYTRHLAIDRCDSTEELCNLMNPTGRYYKLNLTNLLPDGRQPTIEFRQHSATANTDKVSAWVRFCMEFVTNSAKNKKPRFLPESHSVDEQFKCLFQEVIKDRMLKNFYEIRREEMKQKKYVPPPQHSCCGGCANGDSCEGE